MNRRDFITAGMLGASAVIVNASTTSAQEASEFTEEISETSEVHYSKFMNETLTVNYISDSGNEIVLPTFSKQQVSVSPEKLLENIIEWKKVNNPENENIYGILSQFKDNPDLFAVGVYSERIKPVQM